MSDETNSAAGLSYTAGEGRLIDADAGLVARARQGELEAFEQLVTRHQKRMLNIAYRLLGDYDEACEAVQDAFVSAYRNIRSFRGEARFSTWLITVTLNHARNRLKQMRTQGRRVGYSLDQPLETDDGELRQNPVSPEPSQLAVMEKRDIQAQVRKCIGKLEAEYREVIILRDLQDLSYREIGAALGMREGTVKSRLFRAREAVKDCLKKALGNL